MLDFDHKEQQVHQPHLISLARDDSRTEVGSSLSYLACLHREETGRALLRLEGCMPRI